MPLLEVPQEILSMILANLRLNEEDLQACSLVCRAFRGPSQSQLFFAVALGDSTKMGNSQRVASPSKVLRILQGRPDLQKAVRCLGIVNDAFQDSATLSLLPMMPGLTYLRLELEDETPWACIPSPVVHAMERYILPKLTHLCINRRADGDIPFSFIAQCAQLRELELEMLTLSSLPPNSTSPTFPFLSRLNLCDINFEGNGARLGNLLSRGTLQSIQFDNYMNERNSDISLDKVPGLLEPAHSSLICLDLDFWPATIGPWTPKTHPFSIRHFPRLEFFRIALDFMDGDGPDNTHVRPNRVIWLAKMLEAITCPHTLRYLHISIYGSDHYCEEDPEPGQISTDWLRLDKALTKNRNLKALRKVHVPVDVPTFGDMYEDLVRYALPITEACGKLSLKEISMDQYYFHQRHVESVTPVTQYQLL